MSTHLEINDVSQSFRTGFWLRRAEILKNISIQVPRGSVYGFLGANGAGKTTLIHLIVGIRRPISGNVAISGHEAHTPESRSRVGYLPERPYFSDFLTGEQTLRYFASLSGMSDAEIKSRIPEVLKVVGMSHASKVELKRYSKGMLQRIGIAQAIIHDPEFLVFDEPMSGLDPVGRKDIRELILNLAQEGRTIFFSSHVIPDVEAICNQVALIQRGKLIGAGPINELLGRDAIRIEISFAEIGLERARKIQCLGEITELPDCLRAVANDKVTANQAIGELMQAGAAILNVQPIRPSLESFFS